MRVISCFGRIYYHTEAKAEKSVAFGQYASFYPNAPYTISWHDSYELMHLLIILLIWHYLVCCDFLHIDTILSIPCRIKRVEGSIEQRRSPMITYTIRCQSSEFHWRKLIYSKLRTPPQLLCFPTPPTPLLFSMFWGPNCFHDILLLCIGDDIPTIIPVLPH